MNHENTTNTHNSSEDLLGLVRARLARLDKLERGGKKIADTQMLRAFIAAVAPE